jgi:phospholipase C
MTRLLLRLAAITALVAAPVLALAPVAHAEPKPRTPIEHFIFLFQENHTFDNYFGTRKGVDGIPEGTCMPVVAGTAKPCVKPFHLGDRGVMDLEHTQDAFEAQYNRGRMDGFVESNSEHEQDGSIAMGYYDDRDLPYYWNVADEYVLFDRFFSSAFGGSVKNHMYAVAAHPGATGEREQIPDEGWGDLPTIFDRLDEAGISWKFYIQNYDPKITYRTRSSVEEVDRAAQVIWAPVLAFGRYLDDPEIFSRIVDMDEYYKDVANGTLPAVSYLVPSGASEHPPGSIQAGARFVRSLISELKRSPLWEKSAFLWSYDDWGGWYDHVPPPKVDEHGLGFRVPALLVSPYARRGFVGSETSEFSSILAFIESNWGLEPLTERDANTSDLMYAFDFDSPPRPPVLLGTERHVPEPDLPDARPIYAGYAGVVTFTAGLWLVARLRSRGTRNTEVTAS